MTRAIALVAAAASVLLLAACAPEAALPAPLTQAEAQKIMDEQNRQWWSSMFPDEPMPVVEPIEYLDIDDPGTRPMDCLQEAGVTDADFGPSGDAASMAAANRAQFVCSMEYPYDLSDPARLGMLSEAQLEWIWNYNQQRLVPCLQLLGYRVFNKVGEFPAGGRNTYWNPYEGMFPAPESNEEYARMDFRCPPAPIGENYRPTRG